LTLIPAATSRGSAPAGALPKVPTGIVGLDELTGGGLPRGRSTLVVGGPGCGKTLLGMEFLVCGAKQYREPGVFVAFEETPDDLAENVCSLGYDVKQLIDDGMLAVDHVHIEGREIEETGDYDLEGLFVRLAHCIDKVKAKRVVVDTLEVLFGGLTDHAILRGELRRLFRWLKDRGVTSIITAERGTGEMMTRHGLEEYVSDCVILLDHRIEDQVSTRRLRVLKYRGSDHGANEYPFLIAEGGLVVFPITSLGLDYVALDGYMSSGIEGLDKALEGRGFQRGSSILVTGSAGTGKSSIAASFAGSVCASDHRCLYFSMEESASQIVRNMKSVGIDLAPWLQRGLLRVQSSRPTLHGLETHLATLYQAVNEFRPQVVVMDPITNFGSVGSQRDVNAAITRILDFLKTRQITSLFTSLVGDRDCPEAHEVGVSSWMDTWIVLRTLESRGVRRRGLYVIKARGMGHSDSIQELKFTSKGLQVSPMHREAA
jgi:circadian clock protein KaiC